MQSALLLNNTPGSWKLIDQVHTNLFKLELPLPENPLRSVNCYLVEPHGQARGTTSLRSTAATSFADLRRLSLGMSFAPDSAIFAPSSMPSATPMPFSP